MGFAAAPVFFVISLGAVPYPGGAHHKKAETKKIPKNRKLPVSKIFFKKSLSTQA